jgi:hypothetical protein
MRESRPIHHHRAPNPVRVFRLLDVFAAGRIINAKTGRSQLLGA